MTPNVKLLEQTLTHVMLHPETHDQHSWGRRRYEDERSCGTVGCFAFHAVKFAGWTIEFTETYPHCARAYPPGYEPELPGDNAYPIREAAMEALRLDQPTASHLFRGDNNPLTLCQIVDAIIKGETFT